MHERMRVIAEAALRDPSILCDEELKAELEKLPAGRQEQFKRELESEIEE